MAFRRLRGRVRLRRIVPALMLAQLVSAAAGAEAAARPEAEVRSGSDDGVTLDTLSVVGEARPDEPRGFGVSAPPGSAPSPIENPVGQVVTSIGRAGAIDDRPPTGIGAVLANSPGVTVRQGLGGRDVVISIRGNNARSTGITRNMVVLEDGFLVTQADGASRFDLSDPRAYSRIDVFRGPQSALFGNYASGGALAFRTRTGREIDGAEVAVDAGSFGVLNTSFAVGQASGPFEISLFSSDARGNGYQGHASFDTQTVNLLASYTPSPDDRFTLKVIDNVVSTGLPARASLNQFTLNPYQRGCETAATAAPGCATVAILRNGIFGRTVAVTADEGGFGRDDRRTVVAGRWEHDVDAQTTWRVQAGYDERRYDQPFYTLAGRASLPSVNLAADLTRRGELFGLAATGYLALSYDTIDIRAPTFNRAAYGGPRIGALIGLQEAMQDNLGGRARAEIAVSDRWTAVLGIGATRTAIAGRNTTFAYTAAGAASAVTGVDPTYVNVAPELILVYRPDADWALRSRVAAGYATPSVGNLFVTPAGIPGDNTGLRSQRNLGFDLGADWSPTAGVRVSLTGFYELFRNELVGQSPGAGLLSYTFNVPASEHRGIELGAEAALGSGWRGTLAYTFDAQVYTRFVERLAAGPLTAAFDRAGNRIVGVPEHQLLARIGYDVPAGPLAGLGAYAEAVAQDGSFLDNANLLRVPGFAVLNLNVHYATALVGDVRRLDLYGEVRNVLDTAYVGAANPLANTLSPVSGLQNGRAVLANTSGTIFAGPPRTFMTGMRLRF
ncbi:TonB-dependent receptor family protein [Methylobacterium sp. HMF5984]|uniref:TonB-dependent receptor family protein n=1 Tax=Methylobacterium sp. HMF5984 TaxID=3367370 RepID=UPI003854490C